MNDFYVYTYSDPDTGIPFYVGKGKDNRALEHLKPSRLTKRTHFYCRLKAMLDQGRFPKIEYVKFRLTEQEALVLEVQLITKYGRLDKGIGSLCNHTDPA